MHVVGVERKESIDAGVDVAAQAVLDALAHHRALLARDGQHVGLLVGQDVLAKRHVEVLRRPVVVPGIDVAQFEVIDAQSLRDSLRLVFQGRRSGLIGRSHARRRPRTAD